MNTLATLVLARPASAAGRTACLAASLATLWLGSATPSLAWRQEWKGTIPGGDDFAHAAALDAAGNVLAAGELDDGEDGRMFSVAKLSADSGAVLWSRKLAGSTGVEQGAYAVAVDGSGNAVAAGALDLDFTVVKLAAGDGAELWRRQVDGSATFETVEAARAVAVDASGDVFAAGYLSNATTGRDLVVMKLSGATGAELWRREFDGGDGLADRAQAILVDAAGNAVVAGRLAGAASQDDFTVIRLAGTDGTELWRRCIDGTDHSDDEALALARHPSGDVVAAGAVDNDPGEEDFAVMRLASADGATVWRRDIDGGLGGKITQERANAVTVDSAGDVVATGVLEYVNRYHDFAVIKLAGGDGSELWRREIEGDMVAASDIGYAVAVDGNDDVFAAGRIENGPRPSFDFSVMKFDGAGGQELWRQMIDGSNDLGPRLEEVHSLLVDATGRVVAAGFLDNDDDHDDFAVLQFDGETGIVGTARGTRMRLLDYEGRPSKRQLSADLFDPAVWSPPFGGLFDPTVAGAELRVVNPVTLEEAVFVLPPGPNWRASGSPPGASGYVYSDNDGVDGPCSLFQVRPHDRLRFSCTGKLGDIPFSLDESTQDALAVTVRFGGSALQCAVFGGKVRRDTGTTGPGTKGTFQAVQARSALGVACP